MYLQEIPGLYREIEIYWNILCWETYWETLYYSRLSWETEYTDYIEKQKYIEKEPVGWLHHWHFPEYCQSPRIVLYLWG